MTIDRNIPGLGPLYRALPPGLSWLWALGRYLVGSLGGCCENRNRLKIFNVEDKSSVSSAPPECRRAWPVLGKQARSCVSPFSANIGSLCPCRRRMALSHPDAVEKHLLRGVMLILTAVPASPSSRARHHARPALAHPSHRTSPIRAEANAAGVKPPATDLQNF